MEENKNTKEKKSMILSTAVFFSTGLVTAAAGYFYEKEYIEIVRNIIMSLIGVGIVIYLQAYAEEKGCIDYDNAEHKERFFAIFTISLLCTAVFPLIPAAGWPYLAIFIVLGLFSNSIIGITSGTVLLMITVLSGSANSVGDFFMYFASGIVGIILFQQLDETFKVGARVLVSLLVLLVVLSANYVLFVNEIFSPQLFLLPAINIFASLLLIMVVLKYFSFAVIHKYRERYMDLNDQECPLLTALKETDKDEYFHAVHTAYLCDRVARRLGVDEAVTKAGGYYHHIGKLKGENTWENIEQIGQEYEFPPKLMELLAEYNQKDMAIVSKEAVVLMFSDTVISVISSLFRKDSGVTLNYPLLIDAIFKKKADSGLVNDSIISMQEISRIKNIFLEEKLYYDFLR